MINVGRILAKNKVHVDEGSKRSTKDRALALSSRGLGPSAAVWDLSDSFIVFTSSH